MKENEMTTHINGIVQVTRQINAVEAQHGDTTALYADRFERILAAIQDGVDADLISWAIGMQTEEMLRVTEAVAKIYTGFAVLEQMAEAA